MQENVGQMPPLGNVRIGHHAAEHHRRVLGALVFQIREERELQFVQPFRSRFEFHHRAPPVRLPRRALRPHRCLINRGFLLHRRHFANADDVAPRHRPLGPGRDRGPPQREKQRQPQHSIESNSMIHCLVSSTRRTLPDRRKACLHNFRKYRRTPRFPSTVISRFAAMGSPSPPPRPPPVIPGC